MTTNPALMDREEDERVARLRRQHQRSSGLRQSNAKGRAGVTIFVGNKRHLGLTQAGVADLLQKTLMNIEKARAFREANPGTVHVKDGRSLTAQGAKMLGMEWPQ